MKNTFLSLLISASLFANAQNVGIGTSSPATSLHVNGTGILATGTYGVGTIPATGAGTRMMWYEGKGAFRAGNVSATQWDDANIGGFSMALGNNTIASGPYSTAIGNVAVASGSYSSAMGSNVQALSFGEVALGVNNALYTPSAPTGWASSDRIFSIGNGSSASALSNAIVVLKNGDVGISNSFPSSLLTVGGGTTAGSVLPGINVATNGNSYVTASDNTRTAFLGADNSGYGMVGTLTNHDFVLRSNNTERMRVLAAGNIGIGTSSPVYNLDLGQGTFGFGINDARTEQRTDAGLQGSLSAGGAQSGFFQNDGSTVTNYPAGASGWWHLIDCRHSNYVNEYAMQIAGSFYDQNIYYRKTNGSPTTAWSQFITSQNIGSQSVNYANTAGSATSATNATNATNATTATNAGYATSCGCRGSAVLSFSNTQTATLTHNCGNATNNIILFNGDAVNSPTVFIQGVSNVAANTCTVRLSANWNGLYRINYIIDP